MPRGGPDLDWPQVCRGRINSEHRQVLFGIDADYPGRVTHSGALRARQPNLRCLPSTSPGQERVSLYAHRRDLLPSCTSPRNESRATYMRTKQANAQALTEHEKDKLGRTAGAKEGAGK